MKNSIATLLNSHIIDSSEYIKEGNGNCAEFILNEAESMECGWLWFLTDHEVDEFENNSSRASELIEEIKNYVNSNYNYTI